MIRESRGDARLGYDLYKDNFTIRHITWQECQTPMAKYEVELD